MVAEPTSSARALEAGTPVEVRNRFDGRWSAGFEIEAVEEEGYRVRRTSDGSVLPVVLRRDDIRRERERRRETWWL